MIATFAFGLACVAAGVVLGLAGRSTYAVERRRHREGYEEALHDLVRCLPRVGDSWNVHDGEDRITVERTA